MLKIYLKEMKDSFRDKRTLVLTVLLPVIMMTGLTLFYESMFSEGEGETFNLAVDSNITEAEEAIFASFENINLVKSEDPEEALMDGDALAALLLSPDFVDSIENGEEAKVTIIGDSFSQNSSNLMTIVANAFAVYEKSVISERLIEVGTDPALIQPFLVEQKEMSEDNPGINLLAMLIPLILAISIGIGSGPAASDLFAGEKEKKTMEALLMTPVNRSTLVFAKWLAISTIGTITGLVTLVVVAVEINLLTENLKSALQLGEQALLIIGIGVIVTIVYAMFIASLQVLTSIIAKTVKESQSYSTPVMMLPVFPIMFVTGMGVNELATYHFFIPFMNLFSLLKELLFGIVDYTHIFATIGSNLLYMIIFVIIGRMLFMKDKWVMN